MGFIDALRLIRRMVALQGQPIDDRINSLMQCGMTLKPGVTPAQASRRLLTDAPQRKWRTDAELLRDLLVAELVDGVATIADDECIYDDGDYIAVVRPVMDLAGLKPERVVDHVDVESKTAWLEIVLEGRVHHWDLTSNDDWLDRDVFRRLSALITDRDGRKVAVWSSWIIVTDEECCRRLVARGIPFEIL